MMKSILTYICLLSVLLNSQVGKKINIHLCHGSIEAVEILVNSNDYHLDQSCCGNDLFNKPMECCQDISLQIGYSQIQIKELNTVDLSKVKDINDKDLKSFKLTETQSLHVPVTIYLSTAVDMDTGWNDNKFQNYHLEQKQLDFIS